MFQHLSTMLTFRHLLTPMAIVLSIGIVWHASNAAFVAQTDNQANVWNAANINLTVDEGTGGSYAASSSGSCSGFTTGTNIFSGTLTSLATKTNYSSGVGTWSPAGSSQTKVYKITYTVVPGAPSSTQGATAGARFVWEAQA